MKYLKNNNQGYVIAVILIIGFILLSFGYYLYDQLVFSNKMTARSMLKTQLDLHNISIADTVQTILNAVVDDEDEDGNVNKVALFERGYTSTDDVDAAGGSLFDHFIVNNNLISSFPYIAGVYDSNANVIDDDGRITGLGFNFSYCNFINTDDVDNVVVTGGNAFLNQGGCDNNDIIISNVTVNTGSQGSVQGVIGGVAITVTSSLPNRAPYNGMKASSSFYVKFPIQDNGGCDTNWFVSNLNGDGTYSLAWNDLPNFFTSLPGLNIEGMVQYSFDIQRYIYDSIEPATESFDNARGRFQVSFKVTTYHRHNFNRFTSYIRRQDQPNKRLFMVIPGGNNFWSTPTESSDCNNRFSLDGDIDANVQGCADVSEEPLDMGDGWKDIHTFNIVVNTSVDRFKIISIDSCTLTRVRTTSNPIPRAYR